MLLSYYTKNTLRFPPESVPLYPYSIIHITRLKKHSILLQPYGLWTWKSQRLWPPAVPWHCCPRYNVPLPPPFPRFVYTSLHCKYSWNSPEFTICTVYDKHVGNMTCFVKLNIYGFILIRVTSFSPEYKFHLHNPEPSDFPVNNFQYHSPVSTHILQ